MNLGFTSWNYEEEIIFGQHDVFSLMETAKKLGCTSIEFMGYHLASIDDDYLLSVKKKAAELGLHISAIDVRNMSMGEVWFKMRQDVVAMKFWTKAAATLGCPILGVFLGKYAKVEDHQAQLDKDVEIFKECLEFASKYGIKFGIENHRIYITDKAVDPDEGELADLEYVLGKVNSSALGSVPDTDNFFRRQYPDLTEEERARNLQHFDALMKHANHVHIKVKNTDQGEGRMQYPMKPLAQIFKKHNYNGDITFEFMKPLKEDKDAVIKANLDALKQELEALGVD